MVDLRVVMVEPKHEGNVGAVARAMKNFGISDLRLVRPCPLGPEARRRSMHGIDVLEAAKRHPTLARAVAGTDLVIATSSVSTESEKKFARIATTPRDVATKLVGMQGSAALVLGREDFGLLNEELLLADLLVSIPAVPEYPALNVAQAAAILFYEIYGSGVRLARPRAASGMEKEKLFEAFDALLAESRYPAHKRQRTTVMFRRLVGRAVPSKWEFHALMGVLQRATKRIQRLEAHK